MEEQWREIEGYESLYAISNYGRVKSFDKMIERKNGIPFFMKGRFIKPNLTGVSGKQYLCVNLYKGGERRSIKIHRLVANAFIPNPNSLPCINHINEDKLDNHVDNLEWCTYTYNNTYNGVNIRNKLKQLNNSKTSVPVSLYNDNGEYIKTFPSVSEAGRETGMSLKGIRCSCKANKVAFTKWKTKYGFKFRFPDSN